MWVVLIAMATILALGRSLIGAAHAAVLQCPSPQVAGSSTLPCHLSPEYSRNPEARGDDFTVSP
jgi:hypothetical protein